MTLLAVLLAVTAVALGLRPPAAARLNRRLPAVPAPTRGRGRYVRTVLLVGSTLIVLSVALVVGGARVMVVTLAGVMMLGTVVRLTRLRSRRRAVAQTRAVVAEASVVLATNLRAGMVPASGLRAAAETCAVLVEARETLALGGDVTAVWRRQAEEKAGCGGLRDLARAWEVSSRSGASLTGTLEQVAASLSAEESLRGVVGSELAAPRATGKLMAVLPALGIGMGYLIGGQPLTWLVAGPAGWSCLLLGVALACAGVLWIESLAHHAAGQG